MTTADADRCGLQDGHSGCLFCGQLNPRSLGLTFDPQTDGSVLTRYLAPNELQGYAGIVHGGVVAGLLDSAMTNCLFHHGVRALTGDLHVRYVRSVPCCQPIDVRAWVVSSKPPLHVLRSEIRIDGTLMAWAEAKFVSRRDQAC